MHTLNTYLTSLRNKVFKLLPMREAHDRGDKNHLDEYLDNLCANCAGAFDCYPELTTMKEIVEVRNNVVFLKNNENVEFAKWRSIVLRSTRLINSVVLKNEEGSSMG